MFSKKYHVNCRPRMPKIGPNKTEAAYAAMLENQILVGVVQWYAFERIKFKLADNTYYTPDFMVLTQDGQLEAHEVKGHWEDDARVKIKVFAEQYRWIVVIAAKPLPKKYGDGWEFENF